MFKWFPLESQRMSYKEDSGQSENEFPVNYGQHKFPTMLTIHISVSSVYFKSFKLK